MSTWRDGVRRASQWLLAVVFALLPASAHAVPVTMPLPCDTSNGDSRCIWIKAGEPDLPKIVEQGGEVIRITGSSNSVWTGFLMELRHPRAGRYLVIVRNLAAPHGAIVRPASRQAWDALAVMRVRLIVGTADARRRHEEEARRDGPETVCVDGAGMAIDAVLHGVADHFDADTCENDAAVEFFEKAPELLYSLVPDCMKLESRLRGMCGLLAGDMTAARAATPYVALLQFWGCDAENDAPDSGKFVASGAVLTVENGPAVEGGTWHGSEIRKTICEREYTFKVRRIVGLGPRVRVEGTITRYWDVPTGKGNFVNIRSADAPSMQMWRVQNGIATLERWAVGTFGPGY